MVENQYELSEKLSRLQWLLQRNHLQDQVQRGPLADPTRGQGRVLAMLKLQPEISSKELSYLLGIRPQSLNELLVKLEKAQYLIRTPLESDRRVMMVKITEKGRNQPQNEKDASEIFDCLSEEEQTVLSTYLDRLIAALEVQVGTGEEGMDTWMAAMRERMGEAQFQHLMSMKRGPGHGGFGGHDGHPRHGFGPEGRGPAPEHIPGWERFSPDYEGPMPRGRGKHPFGPEFGGAPGPRPEDTGEETYPQASEEA